MAKEIKRDGQELAHEVDEGSENNEQPRGALLLTLLFLLVLSLMWLQVYLQLLASGGIAQ